MMLAELRDIVVSCMPYDTGNMFLQGARFIETDLYYMAQYDLQTVPYIYYQEEGFIHWISEKEIIKNKGFISEKTQGQLMNTLAMRSVGNTQPYAYGNNAIRQRATLVHHGVIEEVKR